MCIFQKSYALLGQSFSKFEKRGSFLGPTFSSKFFCQKNVINSPAMAPPNKNCVFFESSKTFFTMLKVYLYNLNFSLKLRKKLLSFNTVKTVFVDLKINTIFIGWWHYFSHFSDKKIYWKKLVPRNCPSFQILKKIV